MRNPIIKKGFTLAELLIAVSIFTVVALVLYSSFRGGIISWRRVNREISFQQKLRTLLDTMSRDIKNMVQLSNMQFEGSADRIAFMCLVRSKDGVGENLVHVSYHFSIDNEQVGGGVIIRQQQTLRDAVGSVSSVDEGDEEGQAPVVRVTEEKLLSNVSEFKFRYLQLLRSNSGRGRIEFEWLDTWDKGDILPFAVDIGVTFSSPEDSQQITITRRVTIPSGSASDESNKQ